MNILATISEVENETMIDLIEEINAIKVLTQTLASDNELFQANSELYEKLKSDMKESLVNYKSAWQDLIVRYELDPEKGDNYILNFTDKTIYYEEMHKREIMDT